jgi:hypothetical protein
MKGLAWRRYETKNYFLAEVGKGFWDYGLVSLRVVATSSATSRAQLGR